MPIMGSLWFNIFAPASFPSNLSPTNISNTCDEYPFEEVISLVTKRYPINSPFLKTLTDAGSPSKEPNLLASGKKSFATLMLTQSGSVMPHFPSLKLSIYFCVRLFSNLFFFSSSAEKHVDAKIHVKKNKIFNNLIILSSLNY